MQLGVCLTLHKITVTLDETTKTRLVETAAFLDALLLCGGSDADIVKHAFRKARLVLNVKRLTSAQLHAVARIQQMLYAKVRAYKLVVCNSSIQLADASPGKAQADRALRAYNYLFKQKVRVDLVLHIHCESSSATNNCDGEADRVVALCEEIL